MTQEKITPSVLKKAVRTVANADRHMKAMESSACVSWHYFGNWLANATRFPDMQGYYNNGRNGSF